MDAVERMPGDAEAAAAAAGMRAVYGGGKSHAVGDSVWYCPTVGAMPREGKVLEIAQHGFLVVQEPGGDPQTITPSQIAEF